MTKIYQVLLIISMSSCKSSTPNVNNTSLGYYENLLDSAKCALENKYPITKLSSSYFKTSENKKITRRHGKTVPFATELCTKTQPYTLNQDINFDVIVTKERESNSKECYLTPMLITSKRDKVADNLFQVGIPCSSIKVKSKYLICDSGNERKFINISYLVLWQNSFKQSCIKNYDLCLSAVNLDEIDVEEGLKIFDKCDHQLFNECLKIPSFKSIINNEMEADNYCKKLNNNKS